MTATVLLPGGISEPVRHLLDRSHRLGADRRNTNYAGGNTSAKGIVADPTSGGSAPVMWVKGSGGDLATLQPAGLSVLRVDRLRSLTAAYRGLEHEDEMVELMRLCLHAGGGAPPSIDTAMHGLLEADHVDHLHPDSCLALAAAADGPELTRRCYGDQVVWVPWRRPGFQLGLDIRQIAHENPAAVGCVLGGHGITAWGATSEECEQRSLWMVRTAAEFLDREGRADPIGEVVAERAPLAPALRRARAARIFPLLRRLASTDAPVIGSWDDSREVLDFLSRAAMAEVAGRGTSCPDHFIRTKVRPMIVDAPSETPLPELERRIVDVHAQYRDDYRAYYDAYADAASPAMRGADPAVVLIPGLGMFTFGRDATTARLAGEFFVNAIHAMTGAESVSRYEPIADREKFRIEYWSLEEAKLRRLPPPKRLSGRLVLVTGSAAADDVAVRALVAEGAAVVVTVADNGAEATGSGMPGVTWLVADHGDPADAVESAVLAHGGLDAIILDRGELVAHVIDAIGDAAGSRGLDLVLVEAPADEAENVPSSERAVDVRVHRIELSSGFTGGSLAAGVVAALTSGAVWSRFRIGN